jgi:PAS domain S-box-containing protein
MAKGSKVTNRSGRSKRERGRARLQSASADRNEEQRRIASLEEALDVADGCIEASPVAMWCIEYTEPVDLNAAEQEIVRQVFENDCHWRMCNQAMARLYNLPDGLDFNRQRVSSYFPRSAENEAFIRQAIDAHFHIDAAPAVDVRHDGTLMHVENSVRCRIEDGKLVRMWGTVRDITETRLAHDRLVQREQEVIAILSALPDAVLVVDQSGIAVAINPAFETAFGWQAEDVLGKQVSPIIDLSSESDRGGWPPGQFAQRWRTAVKHANGRGVDCDIRMAPLRHDDLLRGLVLSLRPVAEKARIGRDRRWGRSPRRRTTR